ncbi:RNA polymerase sigma factor region1.1 domain-containing protein [Methylobacterium sp. P31]
MGKQGAGKGRGEGDAHARRQAVIDRMLADALRPAFSHRPPSHDALSPDIRRAIDRLLAKAEAQRSRNLTYDDLEEALPPRDVSAEDLEAIFWILAEHGIEVEDGEA